MVRHSVGGITGVLLLVLALGLGAQYVAEHKKPSRAPMLEPTNRPAQAAAARSSHPSRDGEQISTPAESKQIITSRAAIRPGIELSGNQFGVSASVVTLCRVGSAWGGGVDCARIRDDLSTMAQESRDPAWAPAMEAKLQNYFERQNLEHFSIRNVECRASLCAIEAVAARDQPMVFVFGSPDPLANQLIAPTYFADGEETDPSGVKLNVVLATYRRK